MVSIPIPRDFEDTGYEVLQDYHVALLTKGRVLHSHAKTKSTV